MRYNMPRFVEKKKKKIDRNFRAKICHMDFGPKKLLSLADLAWHPFLSHATHIGGTPCKVYNLFTI